VSLSVLLIDMMLVAALALSLHSAHASLSVQCDTTVAVSDGRITIELWERTAPNGVKRFVDLVESGFFTDLPFFRAIPNFLIQFGISPDAEKQKHWNQQGNIADDAHSSIPFTDGVVSYAGFGKDSRSTHLFLTLGKQPGLGRSPWEVPVGKVIKGIDVMHGIYTGYGDKVNQNRLQPTNKGAAAYLASFPKLDRFKSCHVERGTGATAESHVEEVEL
jgi:peptidyl-prolyl cis-trans isomerase A (cyclophilin A)